MRPKMQFTQHNKSFYRKKQKEIKIPTCPIISKKKLHTSFSQWPWASDASARRRRPPAKKVLTRKWAVDFGAAPSSSSFSFLQGSQSSVKCLAIQMVLILFWKTVSNRDINPSNINSASNQSPPLIPSHENKLSRLILPSLIFSSASNRGHCFFFTKNCMCFLIQFMIMKKLNWIMMDGWRRWLTLPV